MDPKEEGPGPPLVAATHKHRSIRGGVETSQGWVSVASFSAAYPPAMCVDLAKFYHHCVQGLARGQLLASPLSKYEEPKEWPETEIRHEACTQWKARQEGPLFETPMTGRATA